MRAGLAAALLLAAVPLAAQAQTLVADLSDHLIAVTTGFTGTKLLLFGAVDGEGDVVVVVRGPEESLVVRRKERIAGIWVNTESANLPRVPSFYSVASSRPLQEVSSRAVRARLEIGIPEIRMETREQLLPEQAQAFRDAVVRAKKRRALYRTAETGVNFLGNRLFRTEVTFPSTVPHGIYQVFVHLFRDGHVVSSQSTPLQVSRAGLGARVAEVAEQQSALYGLAAIALALFAGWLAGVIFNRR